MARFTSRGPLLTRAELRLLTTILSPGYVHAAAREHGLGDVMAGAEAAYAESRGAVRALLRHVIARARRRIALQAPESREGLLRAAKAEIRGSLEALGYRMRLQRVSPAPIATPWRELARSCWPAGLKIDGLCEVEIGQADPARLPRAVIRTTSRLLAERPHLNRAYLGGRVWQRESAEMVVYAELAPDEIEPLVLDASRLSDEETAAALRTGLRAALRTRRHPLAGVGQALVRAWIEAGFLASSGGATISDCSGTGITAPLPALIPGHGVPLALAIGTPRGGTVTIGISMDHRAFDASHGGEVHQWMRERVPRLLAE